MLLYPFLNLFLFNLFISTIIALSSSHWIIVWMALELNIISFIPLISSSSWYQESEAAINYLIFQAVGSSALLIGTTNPTLSNIITIGLALKLGIAPLHFWFPSTINSVSWVTATLLITWQNITPLLLIVLTQTFNNQILLLLGLSSAVVGALGGLNQTHLRPLLAYSSIGHIGWIISAATFSQTVSLIYFITYLLITTPLIWISLLSNNNTLNSNNNILTHPPTTLFLPLILSLAGLPPLTGFLPNLLTLLCLSSLFAPLVLIISSLTNLSFYLSFFFSNILSNSSSNAPTNHKPTSPLLSLITLFAASPLPLILLVFIYI